MEQSFAASPPLARFASRGVSPRSTNAPVFDVLEFEQRQILRLFETVTHYAEGDDERLDLFEQLRGELLAHLLAEEAATHPWLTLADGRMAAQSLEEHRGFERDIDRIAATPFGESWDRQLAELQARLLLHMQRERQALLPRARQEMPLVEQMTLGRVFEAVRNHHLRCMVAG